MPISRFKPGTSGNPLGRPKVSAAKKALDEQLRDYASQATKEDKNLTYMEAIFLYLLKTAAGDIPVSHTLRFRSIDMVLNRLMGKPSEQRTDQQATTTTINLPQIGVVPYTKAEIIQQTEAGRQELELELQAEAELETE